MYFFEEPIFDSTGEKPHLVVESHGEVVVLIPHIPVDFGAEASIDAQRVLLDSFIAGKCISRPLLWYYTPLALAFSDHLDAAATVYDCMDELAGFVGAPPQLHEMEERLFTRAGLVFTGGYSLFEAKRTLHTNIHPFPSSVDVAHFRQARGGLADPSDQATIPHPRLGFFGVIDERMDIDLIDKLARANPAWQLVLVGPVVKIDPAVLPRQPNIHYLAVKDYSSLPNYIAGWDVALMPFAINAATRYISPTKTPEYLAAGRPVVSTPIADVVRDWGSKNLVAIADGTTEFAEKIDKALNFAGRESWLAEVDAALADLSWDNTWERMATLVEELIEPVATITPLRQALVSVKSRPFDYMIIGAGFAGSVLAERLAEGSGKQVLVVDRRPHIGGNAYDCYNDAGILVHRYGPHIFHTNSDRIWSYLSRFTAWRPYEHRVLAHVDGRMLPIPINLTTINTLYGLNLSPAGMEAFLAGRAEPTKEIRNARDVVLGVVGRDLYEKFFEGYTRKQWGVDPSQLDKAVTARIPTRTNTDDRYFSDVYQAMPLRGYTRMFENMLDHPNIKVMLNTDHREVIKSIRHERAVYTGPIDEFFDYRFGPLPYRSLEFRHVTLDRERFQSRAVINYPSLDLPYTRITEYKHLTGQNHRKTSISFEVPCDGGDPYYPVPNPKNEILYKKYAKLADNTPNVWFVGRLATYRYYNMDQVVGQSLALYKRLTGIDNAADQEQAKEMNLSA